MESKQRGILIVSLIALVLMAIGITYSYFTASIEGKEETSTIVVNGGIMEIYYEEDAHIDMHGIYPKTSPWITKTFTLTGNNTTDLPMDYKIEIEITENTFTNNSISYELECTSAPSGTVNELSTGYLNETNGTETIGYGTFVNGKGVVHAYTLRIYFKDNGEDQNINQEAAFSGKIKISEAKLIYISYIEDLVDLSNEVNSGDSKKDQFVLLTRDLDFNEDDSYRDSTNATTYGDYNGNSAVESIKTELTTGSGFYPIGDTNAHYFRGSFDGQNHRIDNLYISNTKNDIRIGLFGWSNSPKFSNLTISGNVSSNVTTDAAGIAGNFTNAIVSNVHNEVNVSILVGTSGTAGGITGVANNVKMVNCSNTGTIYGSNQIGGLVGLNWSTLKIYNSFNDGELKNDFSSSGTRHIGGLLGEDNRAADSKTYIINSFNIGTINSGDSLYSGGLIGKIAKNAYIYNSYNAGNVTSDNGTNGIVYGIYTTANIYIYNTFNYGKLVGSSNYGMGNGLDISKVTNIYTLDADNINHESNVLVYMTKEQFNTQEFVDKLNENVYEMKNDNTLSEYRFSPWKLGPEGYPVLVN